jgi:hypothetical protein
MEKIEIGLLGEGKEYPFRKNITKDDFNEWGNEFFNNTDISFKIPSYNFGRIDHFVIFKNGKTYKEFPLTTKKSIASGDLRAGFNLGNLRIPSWQFRDIFT